MSKKVTIKTVAEKAGVSEATISYVLSGKRKISKEVSEKVLRVIDELGYKPNVNAKNLASKRNWTIGLYAPSTDQIKDDLFFSHILCGIIEALYERKYQIHLYSEHKHDDKLSPHELSMTQPIDGALIMDTKIDDEYIDYIQSQNIPYVLIGTPPNQKDVFYVDSDMVAAAFNSTKHLLNKGRTKILLLNGPMEYMQCHSRNEGYRLAYKELNIEHDEELIINGEVSEEGGYLSCKQMIEQGTDFDGIIAFNDIVGIGAIRALKEANISVPGQVAVITKGNSILSKIHSPAITSVELFPEEHGRTAASLLIDVIEKVRIRPTHLFIRAELVVRDTA